MRYFKCITTVFILLVFISCTDNQRTWLSKFFSNGGSAVPVAVETVSTEDRAVKIAVSGTLKESDQMDVKLSYEAHIERVYVDIGNKVERGMSLCKLSQESFNLKIASLRAEANDIQSDLEKNIYFLRNRDRLLEEARIDKDQYDSYDGLVEKNEESLEKIKEQITEFETHMESVEVKSPIAGIVTERFVSPGMVVKKDKPLFSITSIDPIAAVFALAPYEAKSVKIGTPVVVKIRDLPGEEVKAEVSSVGSSIDSETGRFNVKVLVSNPDNIYKSGMMALIEFESAEKQQYFSVPDVAVIYDKRKHYVFTVSMGIAHKVPVRIREIKHGRAEVVDGLVEGDILVVKGNEQLEEGSVVEIWGQD